MKRIFLVLVFIVNIYPVFKDGTATFTTSYNAYSQFSRCPDVSDPVQHGDGIFKKFWNWLKTKFGSNAVAVEDEVEQVQEGSNGGGIPGEDLSKFSTINTGSFDWGLFRDSIMWYYNPLSGGNTLNPAQLTIMSRLGSYFSEYELLNPGMNTGDVETGFNVTYNGDDTKFYNNGIITLPQENTTTIQMTLHYDGEIAYDPNVPAEIIPDETNPLPPGSYTWYNNGTPISTTPQASVTNTIGINHIQVKKQNGETVLDITVDIYKFSHTIKSSSNNFVTPAGTPITLPPNSKIVVYPVINKDRFPDGALFGFVDGNGNEFVFKESEHYANNTSGSPTYSGFYKVIKDQNGNRKYSTETCNSITYPQIVNDKVNVIRVRIVKENGGCKLLQELVKYTISAATPQTVVNGSVVKQNEDIENAELISVLGYDDIKCPDIPNHPPDPVMLHKYFKENAGKLKSFLESSTKNNIKYLLFDCATGKVIHTIDKTEAKTLTIAEQNAATEQFNNKTFTEDIAIKGCIEDGKWKFEVVYKPGMAVHNKVASQLQQVKDEIKNQADDEVKKLRTPGQMNTGENEDAGNGERFFKKDMDLLEAVGALYDIGKDIINTGAMPEKIWDQGRRSGTPDAAAKAAYDKSPFSSPALIGGGINQLIDELTGAVQLVKTGIEIVRHPKESVKGLWNSIKSVDADKIKKLLTSATGISEYNAGGDRALHQGGKHAVQMAMFAFGAIKGITKGKELIENGGDVNKLVKVSDDLDADGSVKIRNFDQHVSDNIYKSVANGEYTHEMAETIIQETAEAERRLSKKLTWPEVQALFKRGNDFNAKARTATPPWYNYHEVTIEHPTLKNADGSARRFRLDSYNHGSEIVSRKATDLANIQQSTFEGYLKELVNKYPNGAKIVTPGSAPVINGQLLSGNFKLEIPASNSSFGGLANYRQIASNFSHNGQVYNIEIVLKAE